VLLLIANISTYVRATTSSRSRHLDLYLERYTLVNVNASLHLFWWCLTHWQVVETTALLLSRFRRLRLQRLTASLAARVFLYNGNACNAIATIESHWTREHPHVVLQAFVLRRCSLWKGAWGWFQLDAFPVSRFSFGAHVFPRPSTGRALVRDRLDTVFDGEINDSPATLTRRTHRFSPLVIRLIGWCGHSRNETVAY